MYGLSPLLGQIYGILRTFSEYWRETVQKEISACVLQEWLRHLLKSAFSRIYAHTVWLSRTFRELLLANEATSSRKFEEKVRSSAMAEAKRSNSCSKLRTYCHRNEEMWENKRRSEQQKLCGSSNCHGNTAIIRKDAPQRTLHNAENCPLLKLADCSTLKDKPISK